ncbi:hypothetical protein [Nocardioides jejuensis]|uniref:Uncharacterized protein n=1 Tax=Nocardioides jejuensis TaxID=2502782 RepID=A0A4R1C1W7_9ACTN|nr:hypothetical protein [Nocardioides jejuensis]TCJ24107.1 hypothetical protein EPD65_09345 [Nocardioides jejuensis]
MKKLAATVLTLTLAAGATACSGTDDAATTADPTVQTSFPGLATPTGEPELPGMTDAHPSRGTVTWVSGPFDTRFDTRGLRFDGSAIRGELDVTSDVSEILDLQVLAGFYDARGAYLGEGRWTLHSEDDNVGRPDESVRFAVRVPSAYAGKAVAATVGVPVLVNE